MKKYIFFTLLLFSTIIAFAQQTDTIYVNSYTRENAKKNAVSLTFGSIASSKTRDFSPVIDVSYVRTLWKRLGIGVGYSFYDYDMKWLMEEPLHPETYTYKTDIFSHTIFLELNCVFSFAKILPLQLPLEQDTPSKRLIYNI